MIQGKIAHDSIKLLAESGLKLRKRGGIRPIADELKAALASLATNSDYLNVLVLLTLTVYAVRNALFHGDLVDEDRSHRERVGKASDVLYSIFYDALHRGLGLPAPSSA